MKRRELTVIIGLLAVASMMTAGGVAWHAGMTGTNHHAAQTTPSPRRATESNHDDLDRTNVPPTEDIRAGDVKNATELVDPSVLAGLNMVVDDSYPGDAWFRAASGGKTTGALDEAARPSSSDGQATTGAVSIRLDVPQSVQETGYWCVPAAV
ncbi:hypothetical protein [Bifidobacterium biavatii]|uniref:Uncharacterized protein n=1 Tax=Bifidobacterium biavatii DSM 23969 TaxID=1437608 RepID=A0A087A0H5_9BIFI|nr:hypothetical protein [Bifidobacterium biavatii]KFI52275.1 hypothetical protein BBIA_0573 [Bifidobacterium biavatii DSM 23969]